MKKIFVTFMAALLTLSLAACGGNQKPDASDTGNNSEVSSADKPDETGESSVTSPLELLTTVWNSYEEDDRFPAAGGDMSEENSTMDAPGKFSLEDAAALDSTLGLPAASLEQIDDAASLMHMMNANTFTCGAFHAKEDGDVADITAALKDNIMQRQWMCGFPDKLVIMTVDDNVVAFFGENAIVDTFKSKLAAAYPDADTVCDEPIA